MNVLYWIATFGVLAVTYGIPMPQAQSSGGVPGIFIPAAAFKSLEDRANANNPPATTSQTYQPTNVSPQRVYQPTTANTQANPSQTYQPATNVRPSYQPVSTQPQYTTTYQQPMQPVTSLNNQPVVTSQAQPVIVDRISPPASNQPTVVMTSQPNTQPNRIIYVQQQQPSQPTYVVAQPQQPMVVSQPSSPIVIQNPQVSQPGNVIVANPSNTIQAQNPNGGNVYTLIPLNTQNGNGNSGSYLIPIQSSNSNPIVLSTGK